jgi:molybdenum cofactor biosynthesis protein B
MSYQQHQAAANAQQTAARVVVVTLSDSRTAATDTAGQRIRQLLIDNGHTIVDQHILSNDPAAIASFLDALLPRRDVDVVVTTGGTGISRRDHTIAVLEPRLVRQIPGFGELFRLLSFQQIGPGAMLSRATAGIAQSKLIFAMPGSPDAVELAMTKLILPELRHLLRELNR